MRQKSPLGGHDINEMLSLSLCVCVCVLYEFVFVFSKHSGERGGEGEVVALFVMLGIISLLDSVVGGLEFLVLSVYTIILFFLLQLGSNISQRSRIDQY